MNFDSQKVFQALKEDGGIVVNGCLDSSTIDSINKEIAPWLRQINFNDAQGYSLRQSNKWLHYLGICSITAMKIALDEKILGLLESVFGEPAVLAQISYQEKISSEPYLPIHCDGDGAIIIFFYLSDLIGENGNTRFIPATHEKRPETLFVPKEELKGYEDKIVRAEGKAGTALFFDQDAWHDRLPVKTPGRKLIWALYHPQSRAERAFDQLYRQSILSELSPIQLKALGIGQKPFGNQGMLRMVGRDFNKSDLKEFLRYFAYFRKIRWRPGPESESYNDKKTSKLSRIRSWHTK